jgi:hypothetical protein
VFRVRVLALVLLLPLLAVPATASGAGNVTILSASDVDYLDPGHTYYTIGYVAPRRRSPSPPPRRCRPRRSCPTWPPVLRR